MKNLFNSQIATSLVQSERLLALGLKKETADMHWYKPAEYEHDYWFVGVGESWATSDIPAWSLGRLFALVNGVDWRAEITLKDERYGIHYGYETRWYDDIFEAAIAWIEYDIKEGYFNKEYLVDQDTIEEHCKGVQEYLDYIREED